MSGAVSKGKKTNQTMIRILKKNRLLIYIEVYKHYHELALNEDRLFNERLMVFLTSHSILFLGFVMCFQVQYVLFHIVGIFLSFVGIALCVFGYILVNPAWKAWEKWQDELTKRENELKKKLKREGKEDLVFPSEVRDETKNGCFSSGEWPWRIGCWGLPLTFLLLWIVSLFCSLHIVICYVFLLIGFRVN